MIENGSLTFWYSGGYREDENMLLTQRGLLGAQSLYAHEAIRLADETEGQDDLPVGKHKHPPSLRPYGYPARISAQEVLPVALHFSYVFSSIKSTSINPF
jgi:hypothetical protein